MFLQEVERRKKSEEALKTVSAEQMKPQPRLVIGGPDFEVYSIKQIYWQIGHFPFDVCHWKSLDHWTDLDPQKY
jgi:hypothetical protein